MSYIMTKRGWKLLQLVRTNDVGQPSYEKEVMEADVKEKYPEARFRGPVDGHPGGFFITVVGEVPTMLEKMGVVDGDPCADQFVDAIRDYIDGRIDHRELLRRRDSRKRIPGLAERRAYELRTQQVREAAERYATTEQPVARKRTIVKW